MSLKAGTIQVFWPKECGNINTPILCKTFDPGEDQEAKAFARLKNITHKNDVFAGKLTTLWDCHTDGKHTQWEKFDFL